MSEPTKAVFLSYASQDAEAARRICEALRAGGVEVWFDADGGRGGDAWDPKIRRQIKECALFIPVISANTQARAEGLFPARVETRRGAHAPDGDDAAVYVSRRDRRHAATPTARVPDSSAPCSGRGSTNGEANARALADRVGKLLSGAQQ